MSAEKRSFYRFWTVARVSLEPLAPDAVGAARLRVRAGSRGLGSPLAVPEDVLTSAEQHAHLALLQQLLVSIDRLNRRMDDLVALTAGAQPNACAMGVTQPISLSGAGFRLESTLSPEPDALVEARIDLWENGLPLIHCIGRVVSVQEGEKMNEIALNFEELLPEDRERIVQLSLRRQKHERSEGRREVAS